MTIGDTLFYCRSMPMIFTQIVNLYSIYFQLYFLISTLFIVLAVVNTSSKMTVASKKTILNSTTVNESSYEECCLKCRTKHPEENRFKRSTLKIETTNVTVGLNITLNKEPIEPTNLNVIEETVSNLRKKLPVFNSIFRGQWEPFEIIELITSIYFVVEIMVRFYSCPNRIRFLTSILNIFDVILITAQILRYILEFVYKDTERGLFHTEYEFIVYVQIFRVIRLFHAIKNVTAFQVLKYSLIIGIKDLGIMLMYVLVAMTLLGNFIYFMEGDNYPTIYDSFYWSLITMTTVGYGDMYPRTTIGKNILKYIYM